MTLRTLALSLSVLGALSASLSASAYGGRITLEELEDSWSSPDYGHSSGGTSTSTSTYGSFDSDAYCGSNRDDCRLFCQVQYGFSDQGSGDGVVFYDCMTGCEEGYGSCLDFYEQEGPVVY